MKSSNKQSSNEKNNYEKKEMIPLTNEETNSYEKQKVCYICKNNFVLMRMIKVNLN